MSDKKESGDLKNAGGTFMGCCFDLVFGFAIIFGGAYVNVLAWIQGAETGFYIVTAVLFLFCLGIGFMEMKGAVEDLKKIKKGQLLSKWG